MLTAVFEILKKTLAETYFLKFLVYTKIPNLFEKCLSLKKVSHSFQVIGFQITIFKYIQGNNARKVISEVYASFVLQCTVSWR